MTAPGKLRYCECSDSSAIGLKSGHPAITVVTVVVPAIHDLLKVHSVYGKPIGLPAADAV
jgi:hypothetical protein